MDLIQKSEVCLVEYTLPGESTGVMVHQETMFTLAFHLARCVFVNALCIHPLVSANLVVCVCACVCVAPIRLIIEKETWSQRCKTTTQIPSENVWNAYIFAFKFAFTFTATLQGCLKLICILLVRWWNTHEFSKLRTPAHCVPCKLSSRLCSAVIFHSKLEIGFHTNHSLKWDHRWPAVAAHQNIYW